jgi:uncharacterized protein
VDGLTIGPGQLGGKGVYAAREFAAGETVVDFDLQPLTREQFRELAHDDQMFVHSYGGRRWLYPPPARWVNHSDQPTCYPDYERSCDVALRRIAAGEPITIDATRETEHELSTFLEALLDGQRSRDQDGLRALLSDQAVLWEHGRAARGIGEVADALAAASPLTADQTQWHVATGRWEALCSVESSGEHTTLFLRILEGNWQLVYAHRG